MNAKKALKLALAALKDPAATARLVASQANRTPVPLPLAIRSAADWLLTAQAMSTDGDGYARKYSLIRGWDRGYVETTGYIIPTMLDAADALNEARYRDSALKAGEWLLGVQTPEGAFRDIDAGRLQVFDTGQVLLGLNRLARDTGLASYHDAADRAANWLVAVQDRDGAWRSQAYNQRPHAYYSRVAAALLETSLLTGSATQQRAAQRNLDWVSAQESSNGYFAYSEFRSDEPALLHTLVYVLEGFVIAHQLDRDRRWFEIAARGAHTLARLVDDRGLLASQYDPDWSVANNEVCVTGIAQYAGICFDVAEGASDDLVSIGDRLLQWLCCMQIRQGRSLAGGLPGSVPVWGYYGGMELLNWNSKFFIDAALKRLKYADLTPVQ